MYHGDLFPCRSIRYQHGITRKDLSRIIDPYITFFRQKFWCNVADHPVSRTILYVQTGLRLFFRRNRLPSGIIKGILHPALIIISVIMHFTFQKVCFFHIAFLPAVAAIGASPVFFSFFILVIDHITEFDMTVFIALIWHFIPARSHQEGNGIVPFLQVRSDVIYRTVKAMPHFFSIRNSPVKLLRSLMKVCTQRKEQILAHSLSIDKRFKDPKSCNGDLRRFYLWKNHGFPDHRSHAGSACGDPLRT